LGLGQPEAGDVGGAEGGPRDVDVLDRVGAQPRGVLDGDHALIRCLVGQRGPGNQVADGVDALDVGAHGSVDLDEAVLGELDAGGLQAEGLDVGSAAGGGDQP